MCGIAGFISNQPNKDLIESITKSMSHRGPDAISTSIYPIGENYLHLGSSRLSITGLADGDMPMEDENGNVIVYNGEIYELEKLRSDYSLQINSKSDTRHLLNILSSQNINEVDNLNGMFAYAYFEKSTSKLFIGRDRLGIKPLYFALIDNTFIFSSELKAIEKSNLFSFNADFDSYVAYLRHLAVPTHKTGNKNISKLEPGQFLKLDKNKNISKYKYWDPFSIEEDNTITEQEAVSKVEELLIESVNYRKVSDVEVGLFLSGGLDSSLIGKLMSKNTNSNVKGFNIDYEEHFKGYQGEVAEARFAAKNIGVSLIEDKIQYSDFKKIIDNYSFYQDDLVGDEVGIPLYFLGESTKSSGIKVVQVGEGADELFYGYDHWLRFIKLNRYIKPITKSSSNNFKFKGHRANLLSNILLNRTSFAGGALGFNLPEIEDLLVNGITDDFELISYVDNKWDEYFSNKNSKLTKWMTLIDLQIRLPELLLMRMDKLVMQSSIEARVPFLDHKLIEYILTIPEKIIFDKQNTKPLIKQVANKHIPKEIYNRTKQGFRAPVGEWIKKDQEYFYDSIRSFNSSTNLFKSKSLEKIILGEDYQKKWYLSNLANWHLSRSAS